MPRSSRKCVVQHSIFQLSHVAISMATYKLRTYWTTISAFLPNIVEIGPNRKFIFYFLSFLAYNKAEPGLLSALDVFIFHGHTLEAHFSLHEQKHGSNGKAGFENLAVLLLATTCSLGSLSMPFRYFSTIVHGALFWKSCFTFSLALLNVLSHLDDRIMNFLHIHYSKYKENIYFLFCQVLWII